MAALFWTKQSKLYSESRRKSGKMAATAINEWMYVWITVSHLGQKVSAKCKRKKEKKKIKRKWFLTDRFWLQIQKKIQKATDILKTNGSRLLFFLADVAAHQRGQQLELQQWRTAHGGGSGARRPHAAISSKHPLILKLLITTPELVFTFFSFLPRQSHPVTSVLYRWIHCKKGPANSSLNFAKFAKTLTNRS